MAGTATLGGTLPEYTLSIWHGFNLPLLMSFVALAGGVLIASGPQGDALGFRLSNPKSGKTHATGLVRHL